MGEKSKWFDSDHLVLPEPFQTVSHVTVASLQELLQVAEAASPRRREAMLGVFRVKSQISPDRRLADNLRTLLALLKERSVSEVIPDGLTTNELEALIALQTVGASVGVQETAQGLLNVYERYQLLAAVSRMFRNERQRAKAGEGSLCQSISDS